MIQKFVRESAMLRRMMCACLILVMTLAMLPVSAPSAAAVSAGETLYFKPSNTWNSTGSPRYAAYFFVGTSNTWVSMSDSDGDGVYSCTIPSGGYTTVIFCRMNPANSTNSWDNKWNQTGDISISSNQNCFTLNENVWDGGTGAWSTIKTYYLVGYINGADYSGTSYKFNNGSVTLTFTVDSYVFVEDSDGVEYLTEGWLGESVTSATLYSSASKPDKLYVPAGEATFTLVENSNGTLTLSYSSSGGSTTDPAETEKVGDIVDIHTGTFNKDSNKLYVNTTFYDYYSDWEMDGKNLDERGSFNKGFDDWYIFDTFNQALSSYYKSNSAKVPIYVGHFQPDWGDWGWKFKDHGQTLYGFMDGKAYYSTNTYQQYFMSVNNSLLDLSPTNEEVTGLTRMNSAAWGIVKDALNSNDDVLAAGSTAVLPLFNESFLNGTNSLGKKIGDVYENVQFPFTKEDLNGDGILYWVFDSEDTTLEMKKDTTADQYYLDDITTTRTGQFKNMNADGAVQDVYGFFPFNEGASSTNVNKYNYGFGTRIDLNFNLTHDGKLPDKYGDRKDIVFEFSGDDDVWVFIDGKLVLDIGGSHGKVTGKINFATMQATVSSVKTSGGNHSASGTNMTTSFTLDGLKTDEHTLTMFYMERGMWESNMKIAFNFIPDEELLPETTSVTVIKNWNVTDTSKIPSSIDVQLQTRAVGATEWTVVENATISGSGSEWTYTFDELNKYTNNDRTDLAEYRVVELYNGKVLANGSTGVNGLMVSYGDVYGTAGTGFGQLISNNQPASNQVVVIDFGLSVDITVLGTGASGTLYGIGNPLKLPAGTSTSADPDLITSGTYTGAHGVFSMNGKKITYTPTDMVMSGAEVLTYAIKYSSTNYSYSTVTVIPAANIYYEDGFLSFNDATNATSTCGKWGTEGTTSNKTQAEDRPGELTTYDANNVYGYDAAYDDFTLYSLGSARKVTVDKTTGAAAVAPTATFTFTGTGFDVVSLTDSKSGAIVVEVRNASGIVKNYIVNNYYGMVYNESTGSWEVATNNDSFCLYQVPVIKVDGLTYGTYDVTIKAAYLKSMDVEEAKAYTIWVDAIRIYNPAMNDSTSNDAYEQDGESNPHLTTVKKLLTNPNDFGEDLGANGVVYIEGKSTGVTMEEYENQGPNNETYLKNGNGIAFKLRYTGSSAPDVSFQIGAKLAIGDSATLKYNGTNLVTLETATNMFYKLGTLDWTRKTVDRKTVWESEPVVLSCSCTSDDILSLTDLKVTGEDAASITSMPTVDDAAGVQLLAFIDREVYSFAVEVMAASNEPDTTEPDTTEPETTEPEVTDPEVTEPEVTEPEVTEPETTDPEVTEPEVTEPEVTEPELTEPETTDPEVTEPETTESEETTAATQKPVKDPSNAQTGDLSGQNMPIFAMAAFVSLMAVLLMTAYAAKIRKHER